MSLLLSTATTPWRIKPAACWRGWQARTVAIRALALTMMIGAANAVPLSAGGSEIGVTFAVPPYCAVNQGPGTVDAVCDPEGDSDKSREGPASTALYFAASVVAAPDDKGLAPDALGRRYTLDDFEKGLAEAVCGQDKPRGLRIENAARLVEGGVLSYSAVVVCPPVRFMGLDARRASVRHILRDGRRYQLQARALDADFERSKSDIDAFFGSLKFSSEKMP